MLSLARLARIEAFAAIFVPSNATSPTVAIPAAAHSRNDAVNSVLSATSCRCRNRAIVVWSGAVLAHTTRNATSVRQQASIRRDERTPTQYAYSSNATIVLGCRAAPPRPSPR